MVNYTLDKNIPLFFCEISAFTKSIPLGEVFGGCIAIKRIIFK